MQGELQTREHTTMQDRGKWDPALAVGVFAGYRLRPGSHWSNEYLVWDISDFDGRSLFDRTETMTNQMRHPHVTERVFLYQDTLTFPLRAAYEKAMVEAKIVVPEATLPGEDDIMPPAPEVPMTAPLAAVDTPDSEGIYRAVQEGHSGLSLQRGQFRNSHLQVHGRSTDFASPGHQLGFMGRVATETTQRLH